MLAITKNCQLRTQVGRDEWEQTLGKQLRTTEEYHRPSALPTPAPKCYCTIILYSNGNFNCCFPRCIPCISVPCLCVTPHVFFIFPVKLANRCLPKNYWQTREALLLVPLPANRVYQAAQVGLPPGLMISSLRCLLPDAPRGNATNSCSASVPRLRDRPLERATRTHTAPPRRGRVPSQPPGHITQSPALLPFPIKRKEKGFKNAGAGSSLHRKSFSSLQ